MRDAGIEGIAIQDPWDWGQIAASGTDWARFFALLGSGQLLSGFHPVESGAWRWSHYWEPADSVIEFKRSVYHLMLAELHPFLSRRSRGDIALSRSQAHGDAPVQPGLSGHL